MSELNAEELGMLEDSVERLAAREYAADRRTRIMQEPAGYSAAVWSQIAELGLIGLGVPVSHGGAGGSVGDQGTIMMAVGRHLLREPYFGTAVVCAPLLAHLDPAGTAIDLKAVLAGQHILAFGHAEPQLGFARAPIATRAVDHLTHYSIIGRKCFVLDAPIAQSLMVSAVHDDGSVGVFLVPANSKGLNVRRFLTVDRRWAADLELRGATGTRLGNGDIRGILADTFDRASIALAFEAVGSMARLLDDTVQHVKTRRAFGGTLSQFQVLRHRLVDMHIARTEAEAMVNVAAQAYQASDGRAACLVSAAKFQASRSAQFVADSAVQLHGGLGVSDELVISHHFKRLMVNEALYGNADFHLDQFIELTRAPQIHDGEVILAGTGRPPT